MVKTTAAKIVETGDVETLRQLQIDSIGKYFVKELIDTYGIKLIDTALKAYTDTIELLKVGITQQNNLAVNLMSIVSFADLLHGGAVRGYRTEELAAIKRINATASDRLYLMNLYGVGQAQIDAADWRIKVTDLALNIPYPLGWSGMKEVFYEAHDPRLFPKMLSDAAFEKVIGYGDVMLKAASLKDVGGGIKTFVEGVKPIAPGAISGIEQLRRMTEPTIPLPTSEGANQ